MVINAAGYAPFNGISDHRMAWIDVGWDSVFGKQKTIQRLQAHRLQCDQDRTVQKYAKLLSRLLHAETGLVEDVLRLDNEVGHGMTKQQQDHYNELDEKITTCMLRAEKACRHIRVSGVPYFS